MVESAQDRMNAGIRGLMRDYPRDDTPADGDVPTGYMLTRNANGKVVVVPSNKYTPSTGARPDQKLTIGPNGEVVSSPYMSPALDKALEVAQGNANPVLSFGETGMADPSGASFFTPQYTDEDFSRSLALQHPLNRATTQEDIDEEARLKANLALSAREKQQQSQGSFWGGDQLLTKDRIEQMYGKPSADIPATAPPVTANPVTAPPVTANPVTDTSVTAAPVTAAPVTVAPVNRAMTIASQASPLPMFAQPHSGAQYQPMSASSRSWTDMPLPSNYMPWGDSAPAPARAAAPSAAAPTAPAQSSPGFFSGLFKDPYAGMSPKQMNEKAQDMQRAGDEYGANLLTQRADNAITSSDGSFAQGGSVDENHPVVQRAMHLVRSFLLNG